MSKKYYKTITECDHGGEEETYWETTSEDGRLQFEIENREESEMYSRFSVYTEEITKEEFEENE